MGVNNGSSAELHEVMPLADLPEGAQVCKAVNGVRLLVCRTNAGVFAVENQCSHAQFPLEGGRITGGVIRCPKHGAIFNLLDGSEAGGRLPAIKAFETMVENDRIFVKL